MNINYINIDPSDLIQIVSKISVEVINIILNETATVRVTCFNSNGQQLISYHYQLRQPEYSEWTNDEWLINYSCQKYGFTVKNNPMI